MANNCSDVHTEQGNPHLNHAEEMKPRRWPHPWPRRGYTACRAVRLPEVSAEEFLLVVPWRWPHSERPLLLLVSPRTRRRSRTGRWFVKAYRRRWGVEDGTRGIKQHVVLESFLVRSWRSIRRLLWLVAWAFWWLNLGGRRTSRVCVKRCCVTPGGCPKASPICSIGSRKCSMNSCTRAPRSRWHPDDTGGTPNVSPLTSSTTIETRELDNSICCPSC
jgi:hypothetical protein